MVEAAHEAGALGARLSGGGWGGSVVVLARESETEALCQSIIKTGRTHHLDPSAEITIPSAGAQIINP